MTIDNTVSNQSRLYGPNATTSTVVLAFIQDVLEIGSFRSGAGVNAVLVPNCPHDVLRHSTRSLRKVSTWRFMS